MKKITKIVNWKLSFDENEFLQNLLKLVEIF